MSPDTQKKTQVHAEGTDVCSGFAANPKNGQMSVVVELNQFQIVDGTDTELTFNGGNEWGTLEEGTGKGFQGLCEFLLGFDGIVEAEDGNVLLSGALLRLHETGCAVNADDETACNFGVKSSGVTGLLNTEDATNPGDNFVRGGVCRFVKVDDTVSRKESVSFAANRT